MAAKAPSKPVPAKEPIMTCPFTGRAVVFYEIGPLKQVMIRGANYQMGPFPDFQKAHFAFSTRNGVAPSFPASQVSLASEDLETPDNVAEGILGGKDVVDGRVAEVFSNA